MKKLLSLVFGLTLLVFGTTAFAEWDIDKFIDISLKNHSISDTFDISCLHQNEDGNYMAISKPDGEDYDTIIDLSKVLKVYHIGVYEKADVIGYDGSGLAEYFADYFLDAEQHVYRYIITNESGDHNHLLITADEHNYTDIGNPADDWEKGISEALAVVNNSNIGEIYDAYSIDWNTRIRYSDNSKRSIRRETGIYLDTDKGEFVIFYNDTADSAFSKQFTKAERLTLYPVQEFLDIVAENYDEAGVVVKDVEVADKDGDSEQVTIVQKPVQSEDKEEPKEEQPEEEIKEEEPIEEPKEEPEDEPVAEPKADEKPETVEEPEGNPKKTGIDVILFGKYLAFPDQKPIIENDRVLVPFRVIFEALEAEVFWDSDTRTVTATKDGITITLTIGKNEIVKNGEAVEIDVPAQIINSRTLVPVRVISESFENTVSWDGENKVVEIK